MRRSLLAFILFALPAQPLMAQDGVFDMGALTNTLAQDHVTKAEEARARGNSATGSTLGSLAQALALQTSPGAMQRAPSVSSDYTPSSSVRGRLAEIMAEGAGREGQAQADEMRQLVLSGQALNEYERVAPSLGFRANDAVDAFAFYLLAQWGVANDYRGQISPAQAGAVRQQAANAYATVADQLASDAKRQEFAEMLAVQGTIMAGVHEAAVRGGDEDAVARYAQLARQGGRMLFTIDPTEIELTDTGFRRR